MGITEDNKEIVAILTADNKIILEKKRKINKIFMLTYRKRYVTI